MPPEYYRAYRRKHRARLREQENARRRTPEFHARRRALPSRQSAYRAAREYPGRNEQRQSVASAPLPAPYTGHPLLEQARQLAGSWYGNTLYDAGREDAAGEAVLALLEGRDPREAIRAYRAEETAWQRMTMPLAEWAA